VLCYHSAPERSLYSIAEVTRDPYPDPTIIGRIGWRTCARSNGSAAGDAAEMRSNPALRKMKLLKTYDCSFHR